MSSDGRIWPHRKAGPLPNGPAFAPAADAFQRIAPPVEEHCLRMDESSGAALSALLAGGMAMGRTYGYARVSTRDQNLDRQLDALREFGVDEVFADKASGKDFERPEWRRMKGVLVQGDVLVVKSIDRFGRSYEEIIEQWRDITKTKGARRGSPGHAAFGHTAGARWHHGRADSGYRAAVVELRGTDREGIHSSAAGRRHRRSQSARCALWKAAKESAAGVRHGASCVSDGRHHAARRSKATRGIGEHIRQMDARMSR